MRRHTHTKTIERRKKNRLKHQIFWLCRQWTEKLSVAMRCNASKKPTYNRGDKSISQMTSHKIYRGQLWPTLKHMKTNNTKNGNNSANTQMTKIHSKRSHCEWQYTCVCVLDLHMKRNCQVKICTITSKAFFHVFLNCDENNSNLKSIYADNYYSNFHTIRIWCHVQFVWYETTSSHTLSLPFNRSAILFFLLILSLI